MVSCLHMHLGGSTIAELCFFFSFFRSPTTLHCMYVMQLNTMPPVPAHNRAWRGTPVTLEVQRDGATRLRVTSHDNEYIGLLRERLASHMGCSAKNVRMFTMGRSGRVASWCTLRFFDVINAQLAAADFRRCH